MDFVYARYNSAVFDMDAEDFWEMYVKGHNKEVEDKVYLQWIALLPHLKDREMLNFSTFLDRATGRNVDNRPVEVIMSEIDKALKRLEEDDGAEHI